MRSTDLSVLIVLAVAAILLSIAVIAFAEGSVVSGILWLVALAAWVAYVGLTSFHWIPPDKMLLSFQLGTAKEVYVNGNFPKDLGGKLGLFKQDIVILLYPIWYKVYFPTTVVKLVIHTTRVYLKEHRDGDKIKSPGVPVRVDVTILFRLKPEGLGNFIQAINVLSRGTHDLAHDVEIRDNLWEPDGDDNSKYVYRSSRMAQIVLDSVSETVLHAVRSVASQFYTWKEVAAKEEAKEEAGKGEKDEERATRDIKGSIPHFRGRVLQDLATKESVFCQAGMLEPFTKQEGDKVKLGPAVLSFDLRVEDISPENEAFLQALHAPMIADLEADAARQRGEGEGERLKRKSQATGIPADELYRGEVVQGVDEVRLYGAGDNVTDLVKKFLGGSGDPKKGAE